MAIICGIVQLFDHIFFSGGCDNLIPNFPPNCCFSFFLFHRAISGVFLVSSYHFVLCGMSNWWKTRTGFYTCPKKLTDFCHTLGFFLVVSPILMYIDGASES